MQAHAHIELEKRKASMEVGHSLPNLPRSPSPPGSSQGFFIAEVRRPRLPRAVASSKTRKQPSWVRGSVCEMEKPQGREHLVQLVIARGNQARSSRGW